MMKIYYVLVGLAGLAACFYVNHAWHAEPPLVSFILGYVPGTLLGIAIIRFLEEHHRL